MAVDSEADDAALGKSSTGGRVPIPDPTVLTTQALYREVKSLQELVELRIEGVTSRLTQEQVSIKAQLSAIQHEREARFVQVDAKIEAAIDARDQLDHEKDKRVTQQFDLVERQRVEQKKDTKDAVDAALTAQKEAVREQTTASEKAIAKSETSINKLVEQLAASFAKDADSQRRELGEIKERMSELARDLRASISEVSQTANSYGQQKQGGADSRAIVGWVIGAIATLLAIGVIVIDLATK